MNIYSIYLARNSINGKIYVGYTSKPIEERIKAHKQKQKLGAVCKFYNAVKRYGWENFKFEVIYQSKDGEHCLNTMEPNFIREFNSKDFGYNMTDGGGGVIGYWDAEAKKKQSIFISSVWTDERRVKNGMMAKERLSGVRKTTEHKNKLKGKRPHVNQSGGNNNNAKPIITPYGEFNSMKTAWRELNKNGIDLTYKQIYDRLNTKPDWNYIMIGNSNGNE